MHYCQKKSGPSRCKMRMKCVMTFEQSTQHHNTQHCFQTARIKHRSFIHFSLSLQLFTNKIIRKYIYTHIHLPHQKNSPIWQVHSLIYVQFIESFILVYIVNQNVSVEPITPPPPINIGFMIAENCLKHNIQIPFQMLECSSKFFLK